MKRLMLMVILIVGAITFSVSAEDIERQVELSKPVKSVIFVCAFKNEPIGEVLLRSPDGSIYDSSSEEYSIEDNNIYFVISKPAVGTWSMVLRGINEQDVKLSLLEHEDGFHINSFNVSSASGDTVRVEFVIKGSIDSYIIEIYAAQDKEYLNGKLLFETSVNKSGGIEIPTTELSPGSYYFYMKVTDSNGVIDYKHFDNPVSINNSAILPAVPSIKTSIINNTFYAEWNAVDHPDVTEYKVMVFKQGELKPIYEDTVGKDEELKYYSDEFDPEENIEIGVAAVGLNGVTGEFKRTPIAFKLLDTLKLDVTWPEGDVINTGTLLIPITFDKPNAVSIFQDDSFIKEGIMESGAVKLELEDGKHKLGFVVEDPNGNIKSVGKTFVIDTVGPQLQLYDEYDALKTNRASIRIDGNTEAGVQFYINDNKYEVDENGEFDINYKLGLFKNELTFKCMDEAGNENISKKIIYRNLSVSQFYPYILLVSGLGAVLLLGYIYKIKK